MEITNNLLKRNWFEKATLEDIQTEINNGADVNATNNEGWTPLMFAIQNRCNLEIIKMLLNAGAKVNIKDNLHGMTPLMLAALCDETDIIPLLIEHGAEVNTKDSDEVTALMYAVPYNPKAIKILVDYGADVKVIDDIGRTLMHKAADQAKQPEIIKILVELGVDINTIGKLDMTPLMSAAMCNENLEIIKALIKNGADVKAKDSSGHTVSYFAKNNNNPEVRKFIEQLEKNHK